ncbi:3-deoxy-D-manno-octulosonic acid transferase [Bacteroidota bacterium]
MTLYNIGIRLYHFGVLVASFFNPKAKLWLQGRKGLLAKIERECSGYTGKTMWVHCASLGEFEMARPIMEGVKSTEPETRLVLTFFSPSGFEIRKNYALADHVFYLPIDTADNAMRFVRAINPSSVVFVKYDLWYHFINAAHAFGARLILISAQFRSNQHFFKKHGGIGRKTLQLFNHIFCVDNHSLQLLQSISVKDVTVCGDTRYDRVMEVAGTGSGVDKIVQFKEKRKLVVCGSTWKEDEALLVSCVAQWPDVRWVIAPHEVGEDNLQRIEKLFKRTVRFSDFDGQSEASVLLVDNVGYLSKMYAHAEVAYVGGGFKTGLHNILEATAFSVPTVFGPDFSRFPDAGEMVQSNLAFSINNQAQLQQCMRNLLEEDQTALRNKIGKFMQQRTGATKAILKYLKTDG